MIIDDRRAITDRLEAAESAGLPEKPGDDDHGIEFILQQTMADSLKRQPTFKPDAKKFVLWGLGGTLVRFDERITNAIIEFLPEAAKRSGFRFPEGDTEKSPLAIQAMARESYEAGHLPTSTVAPFLGINEKILFGETLSLVFSRVIAINATSFTGSDRFDIKAFEKSLGEGISHNVLTTASTNWAVQWSAILGLKSFFDRVAGTDIVPSDDGHMRHKRTEASAILEYFFRDLPVSRKADVIVIDHDPEFLKKAVRLGFETCLLLRPKDDKEALKVNTRGFNHVVESIAQVFATVLKDRTSGDFVARSRTVAENRPRI